MTERVEAAAAHRALTRTDGDLPTLLRRRDRQPRIWRIRWPRTHPHKDSAAAHFDQTKAPAAAAAPAHETPPETATTTGTKPATAQEGTTLTARNPTHEHNTREAKPKGPKSALRNPRL